MKYNKKQPKEPRGETPPKPEAAKMLHTYPEIQSDPPVLREALANAVEEFPFSTHNEPYSITLPLRATLDRIHNGIPVREFEELAEKLGLTQDEMARKIGISIPTLFRRRTANRPLDPDHSDRLMRFQRLFGIAIELFDGNETYAREWLKRPERALGNLRPIDVAETEAGAREVEKVIGRLEYGVLT